MRLHRFFVENKLHTGEKVKIENDELVHQWRNVLRFQVGQEVILFDNSGSEFQGTLFSLGNRSAEVDIKTSQPGPKASLPLFLYLSLAKRDSFEWALEKGTELGVAGFTPVISERSEKKKLNLERSRNILKESSEQSGRVVLPEIFEPTSLEKSLENLEGNSFALDPRGEPLKIEKYKTGQWEKRVNVFVGPEGGFSSQEIELFKKHNIPVYSFGTQILRAETAAVAIATLFVTL